ncbi:MAG: YaaL family protein [Acetatifactor sp.]|nr:YaaL family protein [Acetatifactor sp.]
MRANYHQSVSQFTPITEDLSTFDLKDSIEKTRQALEIAYAGFDNVIEQDLIDSYIYEINSLSKRYEHLTSLATTQAENTVPKLYQHSPIKALVSHVFG